MGGGGACEEGKIEGENSTLPLGEDYSGNIFSFGPVGEHGGRDRSLGGKEKKKSFM